ncbi:MAG: response regulator transcription factor [Cyanobacteriota bacterium]
MVKKYSILIIEDDLNISALLIDLLESNNYTVTHTKDGPKGLEALKNNNYDLILLDEVMPMMTGTEFLVKVRSNNSYNTVPIIMMTSLQDDKHQVNALREGADDYIQKPFRFNILLARIEVALKKSTSSSNILVEIPEGSKPDTITPKEKEIIKLIIKGYSNSKIANELYISDSTVSNHMQNIFSKLKAESRTHAAIIALKANII